MTRQIKVGDVLIGGSAPIAIQSMSTFSPADTEYAAAQINALDEAGADIVRLGRPSGKSKSTSGGGYPFRLSSGSDCYGVRY